MSRRLVELDRHVPIEIDWNAGRPGRGDAAQMKALCGDFGFHSLAKKLEPFCRAAQVRLRPPVSRPTGHAVVADAGSSTASAAPHRDGRGLSRHRHAREVRKIPSELSQQPAFSFDTETTSVRPRHAELVGMSFCWAAGVAYYLPVRAPAGEAHLDAGATLDALRPVLENPEIKKVGQNLKYDMVVLRSAGVELPGRRVRHDGRQLPAGCRRAQPQPRRACARDI